MKKLATTLLALATPVFAFASEADLKLPDNFAAQPQTSILYWGFAVVVLGLLFGFWQFSKVRKLKAHKSMLEIGNVIFKTCSTYLKQQGKFLFILFLFIGAAMALYFGVLSHMPLGSVLLILGWTVIGILGSYSVAWFGVRMNTYANARMAFASLRRRPLDLLNIPLRAGMSIGIVLICIELVLMLVILLLMPEELAGSCFIGFAIGESLGASALRIAGGIFTKIADIGSDLMKVVFKIGEDDPRNPGVIADCTGDNAGDSIGPTADGFETYGVTGVALVSFILLAVPAEYQVPLLVWIFVMRILGIVASVLAYYVNGAIAKAKYNKADDLDFEKPLTTLVWITSILSIIGTFCASYFMLRNALPGNAWLALAVIISCGTLGAALIPELTKIFTSPKSKHVHEVVHFEHGRMGVDAGQVEPPHVEVAADVHHDRHAGQTVAEHGGQQRRTDQRMIAAVVQHIDGQGHDVAAAGERGAHHHVVGDPDAPGIAVVHVGDRADARDVAHRRDKAGQHDDEDADDEGGREVPAAQGFHFMHDAHLPALLPGPRFPRPRRACFSGSRSTGPRARQPA